MIDHEGASLLAEMFNKLSDEQKATLPEDTVNRMVRYITKNGYRMVFGRWYLQIRPSVYANR